MKNLQEMKTKLEELKAEFERQDNINFFETFGVNGYQEPTAEMIDLEKQIEDLTNEIEKASGEFKYYKELKELKESLKEMKKEYYDCLATDAEHGAYLASEEIKTLESQIEWATKRIKERA